MSESVSPRLQSADLEALLDFLSKDQPARRTERYAAMREKVVNLFRWRKLSDPEALADETFDRAARRLGAKEVLTTSAPAFILGVARLVAKEGLRKDQKSAASEDDVDAVSAPEPDASDEERLRALDACLEGLLDAERTLVLSYYQEGQRGSIDTRQRLADSLGTTPGALRLRAFRIRARLEACVSSRLSDPQPPSRAP